jgi:hypothetical protein
VGLVVDLSGAFTGSEMCAQIAGTISMIEALCD